MISEERLLDEYQSRRTLPKNLEKEDRCLFEKEITRQIPATMLQCHEDVTILPNGILFRGSRVMPISFPSPQFADDWRGFVPWLKYVIKNHLLRRPKRIQVEAFWITDSWSNGYFHWMMDALPRLLAVGDRANGATLLLPGNYEHNEFVRLSLRPFGVDRIMYINEPVCCSRLFIPTHSAPTGNYNEKLMIELRKLYSGYYNNNIKEKKDKRVYISRGKAKIRRIVNEDECIGVFKEYGFSTQYFEDYNFEKQSRIAQSAKYIISNHGAGLTNMLFQESGSSVLELRKKGDMQNNCYFSLASALGLKYYYQACDSEYPGEDAHSVNLVVDCRRLRKNIEQMLSE